MNVNRSLTKCEAGIYGSQGRCYGKVRKVLQKCRNVAVNGKCMIIFRTPLNILNLTIDLFLILMGVQGPLAHRGPFHLKQLKLPQHASACTHTHMHTHNTAIFTCSKLAVKTMHYLNSYKPSQPTLSSISFMSQSSTNPGIIYCVHLYISLMKYKYFKCPIESTVEKLFHKLWLTF
uniref:Uncharacterized protein n=1 Tax=Anguilla anguilla TaxID=7936 RepID=A0A0E9X6K2_ANGAN